MNRTSGRSKPAKGRSRGPSKRAKLKRPPPVFGAHPIYTESAFDKLTLAQDIARNKALHALSLVRADAWSLTRAAREVGLTRDAVRAWVGRSIGKRNGRFVARASDKLARKMAVLTPRGTQYVPIFDSRVASKLGAYHAAVKAALHGDLKALAPFRGKTFRTGGKRGFRFITDLRTLRRLAEAGELPEYQIYETSNK
jgi:hypothetical protein